MRCLYFLILILLLSLLVRKSDAQCFASPGNPIAGSSNLGVLDKGITRGIGFYQYSLLNKYMQGSSVIEYNLPSAISLANYNYTGISIGYGITGKITMELEAGYFVNKTQIYKNPNFPKERGYGFSNLILSGKYNIYRNWHKNIEFSIAAGAKIPSRTKPLTIDGVPLSIDVQPSTGNFGAVFQSFFVKEFDKQSARVILINRFETNFTESKNGYRFGDALSTSLFLSKHLANRWTELTKDITLIAQLRHEFVKPYMLYSVSQDHSSGHNSLYISPQINYNLNMVWNFSLIYDIPLYQYYNGTQLAHSKAISFSISRDFGFGF
jgi:hypothetical protein